MVIVNLKGGAGNQLFQYALGKHLSIKNGDVLKLEIDGLERANKVGDIYRPFALDVFNIEKNIATPEEVKALKYPYGILSKAWRWFSLHILKKTNTLYNPSILNKKGDIFLDGYWQSPKYFDEIRGQLLDELTLVKSLSPEASSFADKISNTESVSIHVRRGDYATNPRVLKEFGVCSIEYYKKAIEYIKNNTNSPVFFVFSDDIAWVKENLPLDNDAIFVQGDNLTDTEEMTLMSKCKHNIIANSSFSWWGAWLNRNNNKIVISPDPWFNNQRYDESLIPDSWIKIPK